VAVLVTDRASHYRTIRRT